MRSKKYFEKYDIISYFILIAYALLITVPYLRMPVWIDEVFTVKATQLSFIETIKLIAKGSGLPLYYIYMDIWMNAFGDSILSLRLSAFFIYIMNIVSIYFVGSKIFKSRWAGFYSAVLYASLPISVRHSLNLRQYGMLSLVSTWSIYFFTRTFLERSIRRRDIVMYIVVNVAGTFTHFWFIFVIFAQSILSLAVGFKNIKRVLLLNVLSILPFAFIWSPFALNQLGSGDVSWVRFWNNEIDRTLDMLCFVSVKRFVLILILPIVITFGVDLVNRQKCLTGILKDYFYK